MVATLHQTDNYAFIYDGFMGACRFVRQSDGAVTPWETGHEAMDMMQSIDDIMSDDAGEGFIPPSEIFDTIAEAMEYS